MGAVNGNLTRPEVAVVIPLDDPRGDVVEHLRTWTQGQTLARNRFQMMLSADGAHPDFERRVAEELAPQDEIVSAPGARLMGLYDAAARAATAPVLLLSEAHVRADPRCLEVVAEAFEDDEGLDAATIKHIQSASGGISPLSERWFARSFAEWDRAGWVRLNTTAVAIRSAAYERTGESTSASACMRPRCCRRASTTRALGSGTSRTPLSRMSWRRRWGSHWPSVPTSPGASASSAMSKTTRSASATSGRPASGTVARSTGRTYPGP